MFLLYSSCLQTFKNIKDQLFCHQTNVRPCLDFFFSSLITPHSISVTHHSKYPTPYTQPVWHLHSVMFSTKKTKKKGTHTLTQCHKSFLFFFFSFSLDSHLSLPLISLLSASCPTFLSSLSALLSPISRRQWQR